MSGDLRGGNSPSITCKSVRQTPQHRTRMSTSPGPGCGGGTSSKRSGCVSIGAGACKIQAFINGVLWCVCAPSFRCARGLNHGKLAYPTATPRGRLGEGVYPLARRAVLRWLGNSVASPTAASRVQTTGAAPVPVKPREKLGWIVRKVIAQMREDDCIDLAAQMSFFFVFSV